MLFVGQAPGAQEDEQAKCFVGPAGQLLTQAIKEFNLKPAFITNLTRCFPPDDRDPKPDEIEACKPYLMEEIERLKPEYIVTLGNISLKALTGKIGVTNHSGQIVGKIGTSQVFSLFHPSFILRYPRNMAKFEMHVRALRDLLHGGSSTELPPVEVVSPESAARHILGEKDFVTFDFETSGKFKQYGGYIRCCGFNASGKNFVVKAGDEKFDKLMNWFVRSDTRKCAFNSAFEQRWCMDEYGIQARNLDLDPMLMHYLIDENSAHDLESVASRILEAPQWDISSTFRERGWTYETVPFDILAPYNGLDVHYTHTLVEPLQARMDGQGLSDVYRQILVPLSQLCARLEHRGLHIDKQWANRICIQYGNSNTDSCDKMIKMLELPEDFNPNSSLQITNILKKLNIKTNKTTEAGKMSVKESALKPIQNQHPFIPLYLDWKQKQTLCNNFLQKFPKFCDTKHIIHPSFNPSFVVTGRMSCTNPPAQAIPVDENVRGMFDSRFSDGRILQMDFKNLEMRILASESKCEKMIKIFKEGGDLHDFTAREMFKGDFDKAQRNIAKRVNFGTVYGISDYALSNEFGVSVQTASKWLDDHKKAYPPIYRWMRTQHDFVRRNGFIKSKTGRIRHFPEARTGNLPQWEMERVLRQVGNFPIQNLGADITNLTAIGVDIELRLAKYKTMLVHQVHDSLLFDVHPAESIDNLKYLCLDVIDNKVQPFCSVKLDVSFEVGQRWGEINVDK